MGAAALPLIIKAAPYVSFALGAIGKVKEYNEAKQAARERQQYNNAVRRSADMALAYDLDKVRAEQSDIHDEEARAKRAATRQALIDEHVGLNSDFGNATKISQQIYSEVGLNIEEINNKAESDMTRTFGQRLEAIARRDRVYNSTKGLAKPSLMSLGLGIGEAGIQSVMLNKTLNS
tara:strand:- start:7854 stop:8384 length:531 start_codon:yes stop_codon:yes gene_type:complete